MADIRPLNADLQHIAKTELNEVESRITSDIAALREWLAKQPHLKARSNDQFLVAFLRGCKYSMEKAKSKLDCFYTIKTLLPEIFGNWIIDDQILALCRSGTYVRLPKPFGAGGPRIQLTTYSKFDPKLFKLNDLFRYQCLLMEDQIRADDNCVISGYIEIVDLSKVSLSFMSQLNFMLLKKLFVFAEKAEPMRVKGIHLVNCPKELVTVVNMAKSIMSEKLQKRFYAHKSFDQLYEIIPQEYFPEECGGTNGRITDILVSTEKELLAHADYFKEDSQYGVNEKLRPGKKLNPDTLFGIEGSFRKLEID